MELPIKDCNIRVTSSADGVFIHLRGSEGSEYGFHVGQKLIGDSVPKGEGQRAVAQWIEDRRTHYQTSTKSILINGPRRCGKTLNSKIFSKFFNKPHIIDGVPIQEVLRALPKKNSIGFCFEGPPPKTYSEYNVISFDDAVALLEANGINLMKPEE